LINSIVSNIHPTPSTNTTTNGTSRNLSGVIGRARDLLRANALSVSNTASSMVNSDPQPKRRRIGHQYASKVKPPEPKTVEIAVIDYMDPEEFADENGTVPDILPNYNLGKDDVLFSGTLDLMTSDKEDEIRSKIKEVLQSRIPNVSSLDFSFVKVCRKQVSTPAIKQGHRWDFPQVKSIYGQGKMYIRLNKPQGQIGLASQSHSTENQESIIAATSAPLGMNMHLTTPGPSHLTSPGPSGLNHLTSPGPSGLNHLTSPGPSGLNQLTSPGPSGLNHPTSPGPSRLIHLTSTGLSCVSAKSVVKPTQKSMSSMKEKFSDESEIKKDVEYLQELFPDAKESYLVDMRNGHITLQETVDDILWSHEENTTKMFEGLYYCKSFSVKVPTIFLYIYI